MTHHVDADSEISPLSEIGVGRVWGLFESAPDGMLMTDGDGIILVVNQQVEQLFGYDRADLIGSEVEMLLPERLRGIHRVHRTDYRAEPSVRAMGEGLQLRALRSDGSEFPVEISLSPLVDHDGLAVVVSVRDVTERVRASAHMRRVQAAIDAVHDGVFMFEIDTLRFVYANDGAVTQTGYTRNELLSMTPVDIKPEFTRPQFEALIAPLLGGEVEHLSFRTVHRRQSGEDVPVDIVLEYRSGSDQYVDGVRDGSDADALLVAIVRDITDQIAVERQLQQSEETFRTTFESAPVGMTLAQVGQNNRVIEQVNLAFVEMLGYPADSLVGMDFVDILHPDDQQRSIEVAAAMAEGARDEAVVEKRYLRADGRYVWALVHTRVIERSDVARTLTHVVDISDRRERQAERTRMSTMEDRERIARDLHDLVIQRLFGAGMKLQAVIPEMGSNAAVTRTYETIDELDMTIRELRSAIFSLHRRDADRSVTDELSMAIEQSVDRLGFRPTFIIEGPLDTIPETQSTELVATVREALSNVARHAAASSVEVRVVVSTTELALTVRDDGSGLDPDKPHGNGLINMAQRARMLGGESVLKPLEPRGCELVWMIPR